MYKVVTFVLSFTVIAIYSFKLEANEPSTRKEGKELFFTLADPADFLGHLKA